MRTLSLLTLAVAAAALLPGTATAAPAEKSDRADRTIVQIAAADRQFSTLVSLVRHAGLAGTLSARGPYTVFAPTNAAFKRVPAATLRALQNDRAALRRVLLYHVVPGRVTSDQVVRLRSAKTAAGPAVRIRVSGLTVRINDARVIKADVMARNGVVHVVDRVLIPPR